MIYRMINTEELYQIYLKHPAISTDTRKITAGSIFVALRGENFDANQFAEQALAAGAAYAIVDDPTVIKDDRYLLVDSSLQALQRLALFHRDHLEIPFIGITGTNGKTNRRSSLLFPPIPTAHPFMWLTPLNKVRLILIFDNSKETIAFSS